MGVPGAWGELQTTVEAVAGVDLPVATGLTLSQAVQSESGAAEAAGAIAADAPTTAIPARVKRAVVEKEFCLVWRPIVSTVSLRVLARLTRELLSEPEPFVSFLDVGQRPTVVVGIQAEV